MNKYFTKLTLLVEFSLLLSGIESIIAKLFHLIFTELPATNQVFTMIIRHCDISLIKYLIGMMIGIRNMHNNKFELFF